MNHDPGQDAIMKRSGGGPASSGVWTASSWPDPRAAAGASIDIAIADLQRTRSAAEAMLERVAAGLLVVLFAPSVMFAGLTIALHQVRLAVWRREFTPRRRNWSLVGVAVAATGLVGYALAGGVGGVACLFEVERLLGLNLGTDDPMPGRTWVHVAFKFMIVTYLFAAPVMLAMIGLRWRASAHHTFGTCASRRDRLRAWRTSGVLLSATLVAAIAFAAFLAIFGLAALPDLSPLPTWLIRSL